MVGKALLISLSRFGAPNSTGDGGIAYGGCQAGREACSAFDRCPQKLIGLVPVIVVFFFWHWNLGDRRGLECLSIPARSFNQAVGTPHGSSWTCERAWCMTEYYYPFKNQSRSPEMVYPH